LLVNPVEQGEAFTKKLNGVRECPIPPEFFIYPAGQSLSAEHDHLLNEIAKNGTVVVAAASLNEVCERGVCPRVGEPGSERPLASRKRNGDNMPSRETSGRRNRIRENQKDPEGFLPPNSRSDISRDRRPIGAGDFERGYLEGKHKANQAHTIVRLLVPALLIAAIYPMWFFLNDFRNKPNMDSDPAAEESADKVVVDGSEPAAKGDLGDKLLTKERIASIIKAIDNDESLKDYTENGNHKALAFSDSGFWNYTSNLVDPEYAARFALDGCVAGNHKEAEFPCQIVNVDGEWVRHFEPSEVRKDLSGIDFLTSNAARKSFDNKYSRKTINKVFAAAFSGMWFWRAEGDSALEQLGQKTLDDCRIKNALYEKKYPCQIINVNGEWQSDTASLNDADGDGTTDSLEKIDGTDPNDPNSFKDTDGDSVPDRSESIDGTDSNDPLSFKDSDNDGVPDRYEPVELDPEYFQRYKSRVSHKAMVSYSTSRSELGKVSFLSSRTSRNVAARAALEGCKIEN